MYFFEILLKTYVFLGDVASKPLHLKEPMYSLEILPQNRYTQKQTCIPGRYYPRTFTPKRTHVFLGDIAQNLYMQNPYVFLGDFAQEPLDPKKLCIPGRYCPRTFRPKNAYVFL